MDQRTASPASPDVASLRAHLEANTGIKGLEILQPKDLEHAVRREIFEEAGVRCEDVRYYMTQPWPYPSSLMIGCIARATTTDIVVDRSELEDARWFSRDEVALMLAGTHPQGQTGPHAVAIAHHLLAQWLR